MVMNNVFSSREVRRTTKNGNDSKHAQYDFKGTKIGSNTKKGKRAY